MIEVTGLTKDYGGVTAVSNVDFRVGAGEVVGFLGPNGAGKSTTLRMITGFLSATAGSIRVGGVDVIENPVAAKRGFGYLPEGVPIYPEMRVVEYLSFRSRLKGVASSKRRSRIDDCLRMADVVDCAERVVGQLSKGTRQRVGLADALLADPAVLILDEPTSGLDPNQVRHVRELIRGFAGKKTVLVSTHILPEVEATCSRVLILKKGKLVGEGAPGELQREAGSKRAVFAQVVGERTAIETALAGTGWTVEISAAVTGGFDVRVSGADATAEQLFDRAVLAGLKLRELREQTRSLEDVFTELTTEENLDAPPATGGPS